MATWKLVPDTGQISGGPHSSMPLVVIPSEIEIGAITLAEAQSSRYYTDSGLVTEVAREVVSSDELHFDGSSVSSSSEYWMDFDGVRSDYAVTDTYGRNAVWSDYMYVYHGTDGTNTVITDSAGNYDLTKGAANQPNEVAGKIGEAQDLSGGNYYARNPVGTAGSPTGDATVQAWVKLPASGWSGSGVAIAKDDESGYDRNGYIMSGNASRQKIDVSFGDGLRSGTTYPYARSTTIVNNNTWYLAHGTYKAATHIKVYLNGVNEDTTTTVNNTLGAVSRPISMGRRENGFGPDRYWPGQLDEIRVRADELPSDWITTEYNNQNDNAAFWVATDVSGGGGGGGWVGYPMIHMLQFNCVM